MDNVIILNSDQPKTTKKDDALGFSDSAESVAKIILDGKYSDGFVIGIEGEWGSGKTSFINMVCESLVEQTPKFKIFDWNTWFYSKKTRGYKFKIIKFNPWLHSTPENLIGAYFKLLSENAWSIFGIFGINNRIGKFFGGMIEIVNPAVGLFINLATATTLGGSTKQALKMSSKRLKKSPTLEAQYLKIKKYLKKANRPFLVVIDDLDRLDNAEIKTMLKLVKSVGKLPYVTYILSYDRKYVERVTSKEMPRFLEKIIQLSRPIPKPMQFKLIKMLNKELEKFFKNKESRSERLDIFAMATIRPHIKKPRDVVLLANSINSRFSEMEGILDHIDFFALECLRTFDMELWNWISNNKNIIIGEGNYALIKPNEDRFKKDLEKSFLELHPLSENQKTILSLLFPRLSDALGESIHHYSHDTSTHLGIAIKDIYDFYFTQNLDETQILQRNIDDFIENSHNKEETTKTLQNWIGKRDASGFSKIGEFLDLLDVNLKDKTDYKPKTALLWALTDICDDVNLLENPPSFFGMNVDRQILYIFRMLFEKHGTKKMNTFLQELCNDKERISTASFLLHYIGYHMGKIQYREDRNKFVYLIDEVDWQPLTEIIAPHLNNAFSTGSVGNFGNVIRAEFLAAHIFGNETANAIFKKAYLNFEEYTIKSIKGHLTLVTSENGNTRYAFKKTKYPELFDYDFIADVAEKIDLEPRDEKTKEAINLFIKGVRNETELTIDEIL